MVVNIKLVSINFCLSFTFRFTSMRRNTSDNNLVSRLLAITIFGFCAVEYFSTPSQAMSIRHAVQTAIQTNPNVGIVIEKHRAAAEKVKQAQGILYPEIDVRIAYGPEWVTGSTTRARLRDDDNDSDVVRLPRSEFRITVRQLLFDGFAAIREVDRQKARLRSSSKRIRETSELVALDAIEAYLESLRQRELVTLSSKNVRIHENYLKIVRSQVARGSSSQADVEQAGSRLASARDNLVAAEGRLIDADSIYNRVIGNEAKNLVRPVVPLSHLPQSLDSVVDLATDMNPTVRVLRADVDTAAEALKAANSRFSPRVDLQLATNRTNNVGGIRGGHIDSSALVVMTYNIFRGSRDLARKRELKARLAVSRQRLNRQLRLSEEEARLSWNALQNARSRLLANWLEVQANERVRNTYRQQFDMGQRSLLDLLDTENELFIAKTKQLTSEFVEYFGIYRILLTAGLLLSSLDVASENEPYVGHEGAGPVNKGVAPNMGNPAGQAPQNNQLLPGSPRTAPFLPGAPPMGADTPPETAPLLDPVVPVAPDYPSINPDRSHPTAVFRNASRADHHPVKYPEQLVAEGPPQIFMKTGHLPPPLIPSAPTAMLVYAGPAVQKLRLPYRLLGNQSLYNPVKENKPIQLSSTQQVPQPNYSVTLNSQSTTPLRSLNPSASYWGF